MNTKSLQRSPVFRAVQEFAEIMLAHGRDVYGRRNSPLFVGQLNARTRRIPAGTPRDPGVLLGNREVAGCQPFCQNLMFDFGLLDVLDVLTQVTGDGRFESARREYLAYFLRRCQHPHSGYLPWGEHVGFDLVHDRIYQGDWKGWHEVKCVDVPWDWLWEADPAATRHEIEIAFHNHICNEQTFEFNRHADMDGHPNRGGGSCALANSGGQYLDAWVWLYRKTREQKFLHWAKTMSAFFWNSRSRTTGLFSSGSDRPHELWYAETVQLACFLLLAAQKLGARGAVFRKQAIEYLLGYDRVAFDPRGPGYFDTINIVTGKPVIGPSEHYPDIRRPKHLTPWSFPENSAHLGTVVTAAAVGYAHTGDRRLRRMFDRAISLMEIRKHVRRETPMLSSYAASVLLALVHVANRSGDQRYLRMAARLVQYVIERNMSRGLFVSGLRDGGNYYSARLGSADLAAAVLAYEMSLQGLPHLAPPPRDLCGGMSF